MKLRFTKMQNGYKGGTKQILRVLRRVLRGQGEPDACYPISGEGLKTR